MVLHCYIHIWSYFTEGPSNQMVKQYHICPVFDNCWFLEKHTRQLSWTVIWTFREIKLFKRELSISTVKKFLLFVSNTWQFSAAPAISSFKKPRSNERLISGQQLPTFLDLASVCTPCCMLLTFAGSCCAKLETGQTFSHVQTNATTLQTLLGVVASVCL